MQYKSRLTALMAGCVILFSGVVMAQEGSRQFMYSLMQERPVHVDGHGVCRLVMNRAVSPANLSTRSAAEWTTGTGAFLSNPNRMIPVSVCPEDDPRTTPVINSWNMEVGCGGCHGIPGGFIPIGSWGLTSDGNSYEATWNAGGVSYYTNEIIARWLASQVEGMEPVFMHGLTGEVPDLEYFNLPDAPYTWYVID